VPHISLVFREMWDAADFDLKSLGLNAVVSRISRKTSEMWGHPAFVVRLEGRN
jgi:hypothetical protein